MTTTEPLPATAVETIDTYVAAWNETDPAARSTLVERALGADVWYRDPMLEADGRAAFDAMVAAVQAQFPGLVMRRTSDVDAHHDLVRFTWALGAPGAEPAVAGVDVAKFDGDGRLHRIIGFTPAELA
jgi:hypothetical protein